MIRRGLTAFWVMLPLAMAEPVFQFPDDFRHYPDGTGGEPNWEVNDLGLSIRHGAMHAAETARFARAVVAKAPPGKDLGIEATVIAEGKTGKGWRTAGIAVVLDDRNYWQLALIESPDGTKRFAELAEMLDNQWNAQSESGEPLTVLEHSGGFDWKDRTVYRLRLAIDHSGRTPVVRGEVFEGETLRFRTAMALDHRAVDHGRPALTASSMAAAFDDVKVTIHSTAPPAGPLIYPPFRSSPLALGDPHKTTGFFHVEKSGDTWWLADPEGRKTLSIGTDHVSYSAHWCEALGFAPYHKVVEGKFGSEKAWAADAVHRLLEWNFTSLGTNPSPEACHRGLAHADALGMGMEFSNVAALVEKTTWTGFPDVFDPRFERFCDLRARRMCAPRRDDPWLIGYYIDNELEWWGKSQRPWGMIEETAKLPASAAGKAALIASLRRSYAGDITAFNADFGGGFPDFDSMLPPFELPTPATGRARTALDAFVNEVAERYFRITTAAVRKHDPNHLLLGCRFAHNAPDAAWLQAGATCDVVTVNIYPRVDLQRAKAIGLEDHLKSKFQLCQRPMILTEWGFPSLDAVDRDGRPLPCTKGAGMRVDTVYQKARCYAAMQRAVFALPFMVGSHYFMWADEPSLGISPGFPENSSYGLVSESDEPYVPLVQTATRVNARMHDLHAGRIAPTDIDPGNNTAPADKARTPPKVGDKLNFAQTTEGFTIDTGALQAVKDQPGDAIFNRVQWRSAASAPWTELGNFTCILWTAVNHRNDWPHPDQAPKLAVVSKSDERLVIDLECHRAAAPAFRSCVRLTFRAGLPCFEFRMLWIENAGATPWQLAGYLPYAVSHIGGDAGDDTPGLSEVPNYWLTVGTWRDTGSGLHYGTLVPDNDPRFDCLFWKDAAQHPDCTRRVNVDLAPGQRWSADTDEPRVLVFGLAESPGNPRPWTGLMPPAR